MKKLFTLIILFFIMLTNLSAKSLTTLTKELNLHAGSKAKVQWERIFSSKRHLQRYKLDNLSIEERARLKSYLIMHAADSEQPIVPGL